MNLQEVIKNCMRNLLMEKENADYKYGCVMIDVNISNDKWDEIQALVDDEDIHEGDQYGREDSPHVTILYGIHNDVPDTEIKELCDEMEPVIIKLNKVGIFAGDEYDVVKFEITDENLDKYNKLLRDNVDYTNDYPDYKPHLTIAYVKSGKGKEISDIINKDLEEMEFTCDEIRYSKADKEKIYYQLKQKDE